MTWCAPLIESALTAAVGGHLAVCISNSADASSSWKGPSPYFYVAVPEEESGVIKSISREVTYGWGCIPVHARIGGTEWTTSLFPKDGRYLVPLKDMVRKAERLDTGDEVTIRLEVR